MQFLWRLGHWALVIAIFISCVQCHWPGPSAPTDRGQMICDDRHIATGGRGGRRGSHWLPALDTGLWLVHTWSRDSPGGEGPWPGGGDHWLHSVHSGPVWVGVATGAERKLSQLSQEQFLVLSCFVLQTIKTKSLRNVKVGVGCGEPLYQTKTSTLKVCVSSLDNYFKNGFKAD